MSDTVLCVVCGRQRPQTEAHVLTLTPAEKAVINTTGGVPVTTVAYCRPCYRLMSDQRTALDVMKGSLIARMRVLGVQNPEQAAERFKNSLLEKSTKRSS